jgi:hypothetical protein
MIAYEVRIMLLDVLTPRRTEIGATDNLTVHLCNVEDERIAGRVARSGLTPTVAWSAVGSTGGHPCAAD